MCAQVPREIKGGMSTQPGRVKNGFTEQVTTEEEVWGQEAFHPPSREPSCSEVWKYEQALTYLRC